jgi:hypothetical protein
MGTWAGRLRRFFHENWLVLLIIGAVVVGFMVLRTPGSAIGSVADVDAVLNSGQPTLIEFYSNT